MTNSTYYGATFLLAEDPGTERVAEIANTIAESHFRDTPCSHQLSAVLPQGLPVDVADQLLAQQRDLGPTAVFLLVAPSRETTRPKAPNVKIPS